MVSPSSIANRRWELKVIPNVSVLLAGQACNMARWVSVVHNISLEKVLMQGMVGLVLVIV